MQPFFKLDNSYHQQPSRQQTPAHFIRMQRIQNCDTSPANTVPRQRYRSLVAQSLVVQALQTGRSEFRQQVTLPPLSSSEQPQNAQYHTREISPASTPLYRHYLSSVQQSQIAQVEPFTQAPPFLESSQQYHFFFPHQSAPSTDPTQELLHTQRILAALLHIPMEEVAPFVNEGGNISRMIKSILKAQKSVGVHSHHHIQQQIARIPELVQQFIEHFTAGSVPQEQAAQALTRLPFLLPTVDDGDYHFCFPQGAEGSLWARSCASHILAKLTHAPVALIIPHVTSGASLTAAIAFAMQAQKTAQDEPHNGAHAVMEVEDLVKEFVNRFAQAIQDRTNQRQISRLQSIE
ncbi:MAG: hypothetical protein ACRC9T_01250 [Vibrionaceae bacterium]